MKLMSAFAVILLAFSCRAVERARIKHAYTSWLFAGNIWFFDTHHRYDVELDDSASLWVDKNSTIVIGREVWAPKMCLLKGKALYSGNHKTFFLTPNVVYLQKDQQLVPTNNNPLELIASTKCLYESFDSLIDRSARVWDLKVVYTDKIPQGSIPYNGIDYGSPFKLERRLNSLDRYTHFKIRGNTLYVTNHN